MTTLLEAPLAPVRSTERRRMVETLTAAFAADPAARWIYPGVNQYKRHFAAFVHAFAGRAFECLTAYASTDYAGVALWLPSNVAPDEEALTALLERTVHEDDRSAVFALFEEMGSYHPSEPHWYLPLIGVEPKRQGQGHGSALMRHALRHCDREHSPAYLESSNARNVPLYERLGFEVLGVIQVSTSPPLFPMLRAPRAAGRSF